jgi:hypothetical protein
MIVRAAIIVAALSTASAAVAAGVSLPAKANSHALSSSHASSATANVTTGSSNSSNGQSDDVHPASTPSPNANAAFGQCVAAAAKTASDHAGSGGQTWNPALSCKDLKNSDANSSSNANETTGLANAETHANSNASTGLQTASTESATGQAHAH